ncbi:MAG: polysaccharide biosynthesis/export family protein [Planctomycetota bacterium]
MLSLRPLLLVLGCALFSACFSTPEPENTSGQRTFAFEAQSVAPGLGPGDLIAVRVVDHPEMSTPVMGSRVDTQGLLHLPYLDPIPVSGKDMETLRRELQNGVRRLVRDGEVTVDLLENRSNRFYVLGHVQSPGSKPLDRPMTALEAVTEGGYFLRGADRSRVYVLRPHGAELETHRFSMAQPGPAALVHIHPGDVIFVRQTGVDNFQEDWLPILSSLGITTLTLSREGVFD